MGVREGGSAAPALSCANSGTCASHTRSGNERMRRQCFHSPVLGLHRYSGSSRHLSERVDLGVGVGEW